MPIDVSKWGGKVVKRAELTNDVLRLSFEDGSALAVEDAGQSCCERRYMTCADDLSYMRGHRLVSMEVRDAPDGPYSDECHDVQFLFITTDRFVFTFESHNEHNGYYGGFSLRVMGV